MTVYPQSEIRIGNFLFNGVNQVRITKSVHALTDRATITIPGKLFITKGRYKDGELKISEGQDKRVRQYNVKELFPAGSEVTIKLGWNGDIREEFRGFVYSVGRGIPVDIECVGYSYVLEKKVTLTGVIKTPTLKELLDIAVGKRDVNKKVLKTPLTEIKVVCDASTSFTDIYTNGHSGLQLLQHIQEITDGCLSIFFIKPDVIWCGLLYTACANAIASKDYTPIPDMGTVGYRIGWNVVRDGNLNERANVQPITVEYCGKYATGSVVRTISKVKGVSRVRKKLLNAVPSLTQLQKYSAEREYQTNYTGYEGVLNGFLQPYCQPGYRAEIRNSLSPELDGYYMVEGTEVTYGVTGARRAVTIGPCIGVLHNQTPTEKLAQIANETIYGQRKIQ